MQGQLPVDVKKKRADLIKSLSMQKYADFIKLNNGTKAEILIEKRPDKKTGKYKGLTRNYLSLLVEPEIPDLFNTLQRVKIFEKDNKLYGQIL